MVKYRRNYQETRNEPYHRYGRNSYQHYNWPHNTATATYNTQNASMERHHARTASYNNENEVYNDQEWCKSKHATMISPSHWTHNNATSHRHAKEEEWREHTIANASTKQEERYPENHKRHEYLPESHHKHHSHKYREESPSSSFSSKSPLSHVNEYKERSRQSGQEWGKAHKRKRSLDSSQEYKEEYNCRNTKHLRRETRELAQNELPPPPPAYNEHMQYSNNHNHNNTNTNSHNNVYRTGFDRKGEHIETNSKYQSTKHSVYSEKYEREPNRDYNNERRCSTNQHGNTYRRHSSSWSTHKSKDKHHTRRRYSPYSTRNEESKYARQVSYDRRRQELDDSHNKSDSKELGYSHNRRFGYGQMYMSRSATPSYTSSHDSRTSLSASGDLWNKSSKSHEYDDQNSWDNYYSANTSNYHSNNNNNISKNDKEHRYSNIKSGEKDSSNARRHYKKSRHITSKQHSPTHQSKSKYDNKTSYIEKNQEKQQRIVEHKPTNVLPTLSPISPISEESISLALTPIHSSVHERTETIMKTKSANKNDDVKLEKMTIEEEQEEKRHSPKLTGNYCEEAKKYDDNITNKVFTTSANTKTNVGSRNNNNNINNINNSNENVISSVLNEEKNRNVDNKAAIQVRKRREEVEKEYLNWLYSTISIDNSNNESLTMHSERTLHDKESNVVKKESAEEEEEKQKEVHPAQTTLLRRLHSVALTDWRSIKPTEPFYAETDLTALRLAPQLSPFSSLNLTLTAKNEQEQIQMERNNAEANDRLHMIKNEEVQNKTVNHSSNNSDEDKSKIVYANSYHMEAIACFNHHFNYGKVHPKPPWYLCANLHDNCEHPYYIDWLDTIQLPSLSEQLTQARIKRTILTSANKHKKDKENS